MDASVGFLLENLKQLVKYQSDLIGNAKPELEKLKTELGVFKNILAEASTIYKKDKFFQEWESQIRETVYDIEDTIDTCVTQATAGKRSWFPKTFNIKGTIVLAEEVKSLRKQKVQPLMDQFEKEREKFAKADATDTVVAKAREKRLEKSQHIVGFKAEAEFFVNLMTQESDTLEVSTIIGMGGLGKSTLAWKIFEDSDIKFEFPVLIWVNVSDTPNKRKVLLDILSKFTAAKPDESVTEAELTTTVREYLAEGKFLIVMDDIWTIDAWKDLQTLLPTSNKWGRVLITTRDTGVGNCASTSKKHAHNLRFLNEDESWELLQHKAFSKPGDVHQELVGVGQDIANGCKGLPLSIVIIGGILEEKTSSAGDNITAIKHVWDDVSTRVKSYLVDGDKKKMLGSIISLSYETLPYELRNCFLYLGVFPEDTEIPVKKLIRLWIAEGFVQENLGMRLEEVAYDNLRELIKRNLVMVRKAKFDGEPKICQIHDSIREICKTGGKELNLFTEISKTETQPDIEKIRRLCIHSHAIDFFATKPKLPKARSFLCFNESSMTLEGRDIQSITDAFGLLRVYDAKDMKFPKFPPKLVQQLNHLRYLTLAIATEQFNILPEAVTNLWNLQTLIVDTLSHTLEIKGDIWKMRHLRHFKTHASITLKKKGEETGGKRLQTLGRLSPESCTDEVCGKAQGLRTLGIQGDLRKLVDSKCLRVLDSLNKLKLVHEVTRGGAADNPLTTLPDSRGLPRNLKILVLSGTRLAWTDMSTFSASLGSLEVLKLKENAFRGNAWVVSGSGFAQLVFLQIERADLMRWDAKSVNFPRLRMLDINNCGNLTRIPSDLGKTLEVISLERVTEGAVKSAGKIVEEQNKHGRVVRLDIAATDRKR